MKEKEFKDYTYEELINYLTGQSIMSLGSGKSLRGIVAENVHMTIMWNLEKEKEAKKVRATNSFRDCRYVR